MTAADHENAIREANEILWRADRQDQLGHGGYGGCPHDLSYFQADVIRGLLALLSEHAAELAQARQEIAKLSGYTDEWSEELRDARSENERRGELLREWMAYTGLRARAFADDRSADPTEYVSGRDLIRRTDAALAAAQEPPAEETPKGSEG